MSKINSPVIHQYLINKMNIPHSELTVRNDEYLKKLKRIKNPVEYNRQVIIIENLIKNI